MRRKIQSKLETLKHEAEMIMFTPTPIEKASMGYS